MTSELMGQRRWRVLAQTWTCANRVLRVYRQSADGRPKLIITGTVSRGHSAPLHIRSLPMRAKLFGLRFWLNEGILESLLLEPEEDAANS
jgi:hypothetical protein